MVSLEPILEKLAHAQGKLFRAADDVPAGLWKTPPRVGAWSAAEVFAHVMMVERTVVGAADRIFTKTPRQTPLLKRFRLPFALAEVRVVRMKTPILINPELLREKEVMFAELREIRGRTLALIEETRNRDLRVYRWRHPFLGSLNAYDWFSFLASHQIRHEKQMREIATNLPEALQNSRKQA
jgi:hypothetical protein